jgi:hypothetical protein
MFALGELVRELKAPEDGGIEGRVVAIYTLGYGMQSDQEVYVQPKGMSTPDSHVKFLASDLMLSDEKLERSGEYGFELVDA